MGLITFLKPITWTANRPTLTASKKLELLFVVAMHSHDVSHEQLLELRLVAALVAEVKSRILAHRSVMKIRRLEGCVNLFAPSALIVQNRIAHRAILSDPIFVRIHSTAEFAVGADVRIFWNEQIKQLFLQSSQGESAMRTCCVVVVGCVILRLRFQSVLFWVSSHFLINFATYNRNKFMAS